MRLLILDFMARRWWVLLSIAAFAALGGAVGALYVFTPWAFAALKIDGQRGWFRTVAGLPLSRRSQASAWWIISVVLVTLAAALGLFMGVVIFQMTQGPQMIPLPIAPVYTLVLDPNYFEPWYELAVGAWVGLGYAALYFLIDPVETGSPPSTVLKKIAAFFKMMLMISGLFGPMFLSFVLPRNPGMMVAWHWTLFALVPVLALVSWVVAPVLVQRRTQGLGGPQNGVQASPATETGGGLAGMKLLLVNLLKPSLYFPVFLIPAYLIGGTGAHNDEQITRIIAFFFYIFTVSLYAAIVNSHDLRVLRALPLSTARLAGLRLVVPLGNGLGSALVITVLSHSDQNWAETALVFLTLALTIGGGLAFAWSCHGRFSKGISFLAGLPGYALASLVFLVSVKTAPLFLAVSTSALVASYLLLKHILRRTEVYHHQHRFTETTIAR